jgi:hypothetical protein
MCAPTYGGSSGIRFAVYGDRNPQIQQAIPMLLARPVLEEDISYEFPA